MPVTDPPFKEILCVALFITMLPTIDPPLRAILELLFEPRVTLPVMVPLVLVISRSPVVALIAPLMPPLLLFVIDALLAPTEILPVIAPLEVLEIDPVFPEPPIFIAVPDAPAEIVPVLLTVSDDPPFESEALIAIESALFTALIVPALVTVKAVLLVVLEEIA